MLKRRSFRIQIATLDYVLRQFADQHPEKIQSKADELLKPTEIDPEASCLEPSRGAAMCTTSNRNPQTEFKHRTLVYARFIQDPGNLGNILGLPTGFGIDTINLF